MQQIEENDYSFNLYQNEAIKSAVYTNKGSNLIYPALGLAGESGEVIDKIKKLWRNKGITSGEIGQGFTAIERHEICKELGDVLWYIAALSFEMRMSLADIAKMNLRKLEDRVKRDVVKGEGDNR